MSILAPSLLGADFSNLEREIRIVEEEGAEYLHLDVMDGAFVPSISFGMPVITSIRRLTGLVFDAHLMVEEPGRYIEAIKEAGADIITVHQEACRHLDRTVAQIREAGLKAGVAINPATPVAALDCILGQIDMALIMTVNPGFGGQRLIPYTLDKVRELRKILKERKLSVNIQVDGGVTLNNAHLFLEAGADVLVAGSAVFSGDTAKNMREFMEIIGKN